MNATYHHVKGADGVSLCGHVLRLERYIDNACQHWAGTPEEFRTWARRTVENTGILHYTYCDTPDDMIGQRVEVEAGAMLAE